MDELVGRADIGFVTAVNAEDADILFENAEAGRETAEEGVWR